MAQIDAEEGARHEIDSLVQLAEQIEEEMQDVRLQQEPATISRSNLRLLDSQDQETQDA